MIKIHSYCILRPFFNKISQIVTLKFNFMLDMRFLSSFLTTFSGKLSASNLLCFAVTQQTFVHVVLHLSVSHIMQALVKFVCPVS